MKLFTIGFLVLISAICRADIVPPPAASQSEVNAGVLANKFVSPKTFAGSAFMSTNMTLAGSNGIVITTVGTTATVGFNLAVATNQYLNEVITPEQYGAKGDFVDLSDVACTNGSHYVFSPSASFSAADIGKTAVLFTDDTNHFFLLTSIIGVVSPNCIQLSNAPTVTWDAPHSWFWPFNDGVTNIIYTNWAELQYFSDDTAAFQRMFDSNQYGATIKLRATTYGFAGPVIDRGANGSSESSVIHIPNQPQRPGVGNDWSNVHTFPTAESAGKKYTYYIEGARPPGNLDFSGSLGGQEWNDSILYCVSQPTSYTNYNCFFGSSTPASLDDEGNNNICLQNLTIRQPHTWKLWSLYLYRGGGLFQKNVVYDFAWRPGAGLHQFWYDIPSNPATNKLQAGAIFFPQVENNAAFVDENVQIYGAPLGCNYGEFAYEQRTRMWGCDQACFVNPQGLISLNYLDVATTKHVIAPSPLVTASNPYPCVVYARISLENSAFVNLSQIDDPFSQLTGKIITLNNDMTNSGVSPLLDIDHLNVFQIPNTIHTKSELFSDGLFSNLGIPSENSGLVFDMPFIQRSSVYPFQFYDWSANGKICSLTDGYVFNTVQSPAGSGIQLLSGTQLNATLGVGDYSTNFTMSILARMTNNVTTYLIQKNSVLGSGVGTTLFISPSGGGSQVGVSAWKADSTLISASAVTASSLADNIWHIYTLTVSNLNLSIYLDGALIATKANSTNLAAFVTGGTIGIGNGESVADCKVWSRVLGNDEIESMARKVGLGQAQSGGGITAAQATNAANTVYSNNPAGYLSSGGVFVGTGVFTGDGTGLTNSGVMSSTTNELASLRDAAAIARAANNGSTLTDYQSTNLVTSAGVLASSGSATNYTVNLRPGELGNIQQIYLANTNCFITFTGTNVADNSRTVIFRCWTNSINSQVSFALPAYRTNAPLSLTISNGCAAVFTFYNPDITGSNVLVSDAGRWK